MTRLQTSAPETMRTRHVHEPFLTAALWIALTTGFGYGAIMVGMLAFGIVPGTWYPPLLQAHGHAQLFGWLGCFVLGMALYFLPRLRGIRLHAQTRLPYAFALFVGGIVLRTVAQPLAGWFTAIELLRALMLLSAILEMAGLLVIASIFFATERAEPKLKREAPAYPVVVFAQLAFVSFALAVGLNLAGAWNAFASARSIIPARYDQTTIQLLLYGVAVPMVILFSLRNLPLFLHLPIPATRGWRTLAFVYAAALLLRLLPNLLALADDLLLPIIGSALQADYLILFVFDALAVVGALLLNVCILIFLWRLKWWRQRPDQLYRAREQNAARRKLPDTGEYGRFEWLIYSAFAWLVFAALLDMWRAIPALNELYTIPQDLARHALMVGFITLMIFGMAVRMAPGFSGKRGIAYPDLVMWLVVLGNAAAFLRVVPALFPESKFALMLWGLSGFIGWCAVLALAVMLTQTFREPQAVSQK